MFLPHEPPVKLRVKRDDEWLVFYVVLFRSGNREDLQVLARSQLEVGGRVKP